MTEQIARESYWGKVKKSRIPADREYERIAPTMDKGKISMHSCDLHESPDPPKGGLTHSQSVPDEKLRDCQAKAEQLHDILCAESEALKQFDSTLLLQLNSKKEYSLRVLYESMQTLKGCGPRSEQMEDSHSLETLRDLLHKNNQLNCSNRVFIEGALDHYQSLLLTLFPTVYGQNEGNPAHQMVSCRGVAIQRKA